MMKRHESGGNFFWPCFPVISSCIRSTYSRSIIACGWSCLQKLMYIYESSKARRLTRKGKRRQRTKILVKSVVKSMSARGQQLVRQRMAVSRNSHILALVQGVWNLTHFLELFQCSLSHPFHTLLLPHSQVPKLRNVSIEVMQAWRM